VKFCWCRRNHFRCEQPDGAALNLQCET
jgi:hypothetical protein